jgi:hypothetical protein
MKMDILDTAGMDKSLKLIASTGKKLDNLIQQVGVSALAHLKAHGDIVYVNRLYNNLPAGARKAALSSWFLTHGSIVANTGTKEEKAEKPFLFTKDKTTNVEGAFSDPWYDHTPDKKPDEVFDLQKALEALLKRASKAAKDGKLTGGADLLNKLRECVPEVVTARVNEPAEPKGEDKPAEQPAFPTLDINAVEPALM